jgi:hypothetical protein
MFIIKKNPSKKQYVCQECEQINQSNETDLNIYFQKNHARSIFFNKSSKRHFPSHVESDGAINRAQKCGLVYDFETIHLLLSKFSQ